MNVFEFMSAAQIADVNGRRRLMDVTAALQRGIDSSSGRLELPPGDYRIHPSGAGHALLVRNGSFQLIGRGATIYLPSTGNHQAVRFERCIQSSVRGVRFVGSGTRGSNSGQGLVQFYLGAGFTFEDCAFDDANCDGLAVAGVAGVTIKNCTSRKAAKAGIYVNNSRDVRVTGNSVENFGGFRAGSNVVGAGLQLSGNEDLLADGNIIRNGLGAGILCDHSGDSLPLRNRIVRNLAESVDNQANASVSGGIRLTSSSSGRPLGTVIEGNTVRDCGIYNYYLENHRGCIVRDNVGSGSRESNYVFGSMAGATVNGNTAINSNTSRKPGQSAYVIINNSHGIAGFRNKALNTDGFTPSAGSNDLRDYSGNANALNLEQA